MESKAISRLAAAVCAAGFAVSAAASTIAVDKAARAVSFDAVATGCGQDATVEFFLAGPGSDHDYETMFLLVDSVAELAAAFDEAGIPRGRPVSYRDCRFWPVGEKVVFEPDLWDFIAETRGEAKAPVVFTGGSRSSDGAPHAATNMPLAVFALYDCGQSLMQFDRFTDLQSDLFQGVQAGHGVLCHHGNLLAADLLPFPFCLELGQVKPVVHDGAVCDLSVLVEHADKELGEHALAGTGLTHNREGLPFIEVQGAAADSLQLLAAERELDLNILC